MKIMSAQKARGADMESGGIVQRIKALVPVLIPLCLSLAFRRPTIWHGHGEPLLTAGGQNQNEEFEVRPWTRWCWFSLCCFGPVLSRPTF